MHPIQLAFWLSVFGLALFLEIIKPGGPGGPGGPPTLIHKLPTELTVKILLSALEGTVWSPTDLQRLASVCTSWRNIILSTPRFWHCVIDSNHGRNSCPLVLKRNWLGPLDLCIRGCDTRRCNTEVIFHLIRLITPESRRIRSLSFAVKSNPLYFQQFFETTPLPSMTSLFVSAIPRNGSPVSIHIGDGVPLHHLRLDNVAITWDTPRLRGLETLSLSNLNQDTPTIAQLHHILSSTPALRRLSLFNWKAQLTPGYRTIHEISPITLPFLTDVKVRGLPEEVRTRLLYMLQLPSLRNFTWMDAEDLDGWTVAESGRPLVLRMSAQCIRPSRELAISCEWSGLIWTLGITSKRWTNTPMEKDTVESCTSVDLRIKASNVSDLVELVVTLLSDCKAVLFETNCEQAAESFRKQLSRPGTFFAVKLSPLSGIEPGYLGGDVPAFFHI